MRFSSDTTARFDDEERPGARRRKRPVPGRSGTLLQEPFVVAHHQLRLELLHRVQRHADHDTLIEVKSTTSVKQEHVWDCAIQTWVARGAGRQVTRVMHGHVNTGFVAGVPRRAVWV